MLYATSFDNSLSHLSSDDTNCYSGNMDINKIIGKNIVRIRMLQNLSQEELARKIGIMREALSRYENGGGISSGRFEEFCKSLDAEPWEFFINSDTPIVKDQNELGYLMNIREAETLGIDVTEIFDLLEMKIQKAKGNRISFKYEIPHKEAISFNADSNRSQYKKKRGRQKA